jgi:hypothetical protein
MIRAALALALLAAVTGRADARCWVAMDCTNGQAEPMQDCDTISEPRPIPPIPPIGPICPIASISPIGPIPPIPPVGTNWCGLRFVSDPELQKFDWKMVCLQSKPRPR